MSTKLLEKELATYEHKRDELLAKAKGKFVLIKDDEVVDVFRLPNRCYTSRLRTFRQRALSRKAGCGD